MHLNLSNYQLKINCHVYIGYIHEPHGNHKQKPMIYTQKIKIKGPKHNTKESHQVTKEKSNREERNKEELQKEPEKN